jgi:hypothetical protein
MNVEISSFNGLYDERIYRLIEGGINHIPERLQEMDPGYFILLNRKTDKFEVHHKEQRPGETFCITIPYDELDERTVRLVWETRIERLHDLIEQMHKNNEKVDRDRDNYFRDYVKWVGTETYRYVCNHESKETLDPGAFKTRWV